MRSIQYWEATSEDEFLDHIKRMEKSPTMHPDIPLYPNVYSVFKNKLSCDQQQKSILNHQKNPATESHKKVQFAESKGTAEFNKNEEKNINTQADAYINQKHKNFELHKWRTFKVSC